MIYNSQNTQNTVNTDSHEIIQTINNDHLTTKQKSKLKKKADREQQQKQKEYSLDKQRVDEKRPSEKKTEYNESGHSYSLSSKTVKILESTTSSSISTELSELNSASNLFFFLTFKYSSPSSSQLTL